MRKLGIGLLGLLLGLLVGLVVHDVIARAVLDDGAFPDSLPLALLVGFLMPVLAVVGMVSAVAIDNRRTKRNRGPR